MKVCFLGGARYNHPLDATSKKKFKLLAELGEMFVIAFSENLRPLHFVQHARFYLFPKLPMPILRYWEMFALGPFLALWLIFRHRIRVLVAQSPYEGFAAAIAKKIANWFAHKVVLIVESHGDFEESIFLQRRIRWPGFYRFLMRYVANFALKHADLLRAVSNSTRSQLERWAPGKPIVQFAAWTDIEVFFEASDNCQKTDNTIVYAGVLIPRKGVHFLIDAFAKIAWDFPNATLWIIGKAENMEYARSLKTQVARLSLNGRVVFMDAMPQKELAQHIAQSCVLILPSLSEGLGRVIFEAMACGTPVIGSHVDGIPEMIEDGMTGFLVPPGDAHALANQIRWILSHPEEARQMGKRARDFAQSFLPEATSKAIQLLQMARSILQEGGNAPTTLNQQMLMTLDRLQNPLDSSVSKKVDLSESSLCGRGE
ncbi:MAG: glycosyltransferase [Anaerolineae bacterium]|nr:glycosyltransferase [Anaerolineae bacterium]